MRQDRAVVVVFSLTLFLSALLLFSVQPMFTKLVLPKLGGSPSVWAVSMCFFQVMLLAGYGYAYALTRWIENDRAILIHLGLMTLTCLALPFGVPASFDVPPQDGAYLWLLALLVAGVGLPFFAVSANAPLLQHWFSRIDTPYAADPYFLYGASNLGSLIALFAYPVAVEPFVGLRSQGELWFIGFVVLALSIAFAGALMLRCAPRPATDPREAGGASVRGEGVGWQDRAVWIALSFLPSGLVVAVTTYITTDIASAPFLWVIPLGLFLLTFVLTFRERLPFSYRLACEGLTVAALVTILTQTKLISSVAAIIGFFLAAIVCHRELYNRRPSAQHLTEFYFWMSLGGVLGGAFAALLAPQIFTSVFEFPLLILLALLCRPGVVLGRDKDVDGVLDWRRLTLIAAAVLGLLGAFKLAAALEWVSASRMYLAGLIGLICCGLILIRKWPEHRAALVVTMIACAWLVPADVNSVHVERGFFGTHRIMLTDDRDVRLLLNGTTIHGAQRIKDAAGRAVSASLPATYYHPQGPMARGLEVARSSRQDVHKPLSVGVVGLGSGSLAYYAQGGETWRYFEIDPAVARIASDPRYFDFLERAEVKPDIVIGDARLTLAREAGDAFGYLLIDAFSSDSIPVHLLTVEALRQFVSKLDPDGLLAIHISNRHLDLAPALASTVGQIPGVASVLVDDQQPTTSVDVMSSQVVFVARKQSVIDRVASWKNAQPLAPSQTKPWTDDYADVLGALLRRLVKG